MRALLVFLFLAGTFDTVYASDFSAKVIAVLDGDTVLIKRAGGLVKIRLAEIDAPEKTQVFGETARRSLADMVLGKQVRISTEAVDQYGRIVAHLSADGLDVNAEQIRRGMAWEYSNFHGNRLLVALQEEARTAPRGLWAENKPTPPWEWRKQHPDTQSAPPRNAAPSGANCGKKRCAEMATCAEARHDFSACGARTLDGDSDGQPCEALCGGAAPQKR